MRRPAKFVPGRGDVVILTLDPTQGSEQAGTRPVLVLSPEVYNDKAGRLVCVPITSKIRNDPFELRLPKTSDSTGVVLCDQLRTLDWIARKPRFIEKLSSEFFSEVIDRIDALLKDDA